MRAHMHILSHPNQPPTMTKSIVWNCEVKTSGPKSPTGATSPQAQQSLATVGGQDWGTRSTSGCGGMKEKPCQPTTELDPSNHLP
jgi:hypothetical protein